MKRLMWGLIVCFLWGLHWSSAGFSPFFLIEKGVEDGPQIRDQRQWADYSSLKLQEQIHQLWPEMINTFSWGYNPQLRETAYFPEKLLLKWKKQKSDSDLVFFYSSKDISMLEPCTKHNYLLAFDYIDGKIIEPGSWFNFNSFLANLRGYCTGRWAKNFTFYGGVCGVASQIFRAGLSSPQVSIDKRRGHNDRYAKYYGDQVEGDDAAVYEWSKQLHFTNSSSYPFIIKTLKRWDMTYLFFVTFEKAVENQWVAINKTKKSPLSVDMNKTIYQNTIHQEIECKNQISPLFSPLYLDCKHKSQIEALQTQHFQSKYFRIQDRSL